MLLGPIQAVVIAKNKGLRFSFHPPQKYLAKPRSLAKKMPPLRNMGFNKALLKETNGDKPLIRPYFRGGT